MTVKQKISKDAKDFAREIIEKEFKQSASDELIQSVAKKLSRAMPIKVLSKLSAEKKLEVA